NHRGYNYLKSLAPCTNYSSEMIVELCEVLCDYSRSCNRGTSIFEAIEAIGTVRKPPIGVCYSELDMVSIVRYVYMCMIM
ncbi:MAG: hypothetical protein ACK56F_16900, partial [bacterium]